jgi:hypothetical protein
LSQVRDASQSVPITLGLRQGFPNDDRAGAANADPGRAAARVTDPLSPRLY